MGITIKDVAIEAGVSVMTVSRVVNAKDNISPETRARVQKAIDKLGYRPNKIARMLVGSRSSLIYIIVPDIANPFFMDIVKGCERAALSCDYNVILGDSDGHSDIELKYIEEALLRKADGIVLIAPRCDVTVIEELSEQINIVIIDRELDCKNVIQLYTDNRTGAEMAVEYLVEMGHEKIALISGPEGVFNSRMRTDGYNAVLKKNNIPPDPELTVKGDFSFESGCEAFRYLNKAGKDYTAIFASNDLMALGFIQTAQGAGKSIPGDISVVGFDDISFSALSFPALTTVNHPLQTMGEKSVAQLIKKITGSEEGYYVEILKGSLVVRDSVKKISWK